MQSIDRSEIDAIPWSEWENVEGTWLRRKVIPNHLRHLCTGMVMNPERLFFGDGRLELLEHAHTLTGKKGRRSLSHYVRFKILHRDVFTCQYCGAKAPDVELHVDHVIPVCKGGSNSEDNLVTSCSICNFGKGSITLDVTGTKETISKTKIHTDSEPDIRRPDGGA